MTRLRLLVGTAVLSMGSLAALQIVAGLPPAPRTLWPTPWWRPLVEHLAVWGPGLWLAINAWQRPRRPDLPYAMREAALAIVVGVLGAAAFAQWGMADPRTTPLRAAIGMLVILMVGTCIGALPRLPDWIAAWRHRDAVWVARHRAREEREERRVRR